MKNVLFCLVIVLMGLAAYADNAAGEIDTRVYDVTDLVTPVPDFPGPNIELPSAPGGAGWAPPQAQTPPVMTFTTDELIEMLRKNTGKLPDGKSIWDDKNCYIKKFGDTKIIVAAPASSHKEIASLPKYGAAIRLVKNESAPKEQDKASGEKGAEVTNKDEKDSANNGASAPRWRKMMVDRKERWEKMTPEQKERIKHVFKKYQKLSPEQKEYIMQVHKRMQQLPPEKRAELREKLQNLPPEKRKELLEKARQFSEMSPVRRELVRDMMEAIKNLPEEKRKELQKLPPEERRKELQKLLEEDLNKKFGEEKIKEIKQLSPEQRREQLKKLLEEKRREQQKKLNQKPAEKCPPKNKTNGQKPQGKEARK